MKRVSSVMIIVLLAAIICVVGCKGDTNQGNTGSTVGTVEANQQPDRIADLAEPTSLDDQFSYAYGYLFAESSFYNGFYINTAYFALGSMDAKTGNSRFYVLSDIDSIMTKYDEKMAAEIEAAGDEGLKELIPDQTPLSYAELESLTKPTELDKQFSYAYGYLIMEAASYSGFALNSDYFAAGAMDAGTGASRYFELEEIDTILYKYYEKLTLENDAETADLAAKNLAEAEAFLEINYTRENVHETPSGLQYEILVQGDGEIPTQRDDVMVNYKLMSLDGRVIEDSRDWGQPAGFNLRQLIVGAAEGIGLMREGSTYRFWIHPDLAYGALGSTSVEPNALLIFEFELLEIVL